MDPQFEELCRERNEIEEQAKSHDPKFKLFDHVRKTKGSDWSGHVVGTYSTSLTPEGYCVESDAHYGSVQIYPAATLELCQPSPSAPQHPAASRP